MKRTREEAEQTREEIFQAGIWLLSTQGINETSMTDIARKAGVSRGAIYWHFQNKEDLLREIRGRLNRFYADIAETLAHEKTPISVSMGRMIRILLDKYRNDEEYRRLQDLQLQIGILHAGDDYMRTEMNEAKKCALDQIGKALERDVSGAGWTPSLLFMIVQSFLGGLFIRQYINQETMSDEEIATSAEFLTRGIEAAGH